MPTACMNAYTMVGPTKLKPCAFNAFDINRAASVSVGTSVLSRKFVRIGRPSTKSHRKVANEPRSWIASHALALRTDASIFERLRTMPGSAISASIFSGPHEAITSGLNPSNAVRKFSRLRRIVIQASPAWNPSRISFSNSARSSNSGTPQSVS